MATIDEVLAVDDRGAKTVDVPEWKTSINVASMSGTERSNLERDFAGKKAGQDPAGFRIAVLTACLKRPDGQPFATRDQIVKLMAKSARPIERLFSAACEASGLTDEAIEEMEKN